MPDTASTIHPNLLGSPDDSATSGNKTIVDALISRIIR